MKKTYFIMTIFILIIASIGCMKTETGTDNEEETTISVEEKIGELDFEQSYITSELSENFVVDAVITPKAVYDKEIGLYKYQKFTEDDYDRDILIQALTAYNEKHVEGDMPEINASVDSFVMSSFLTSAYNEHYEIIMDCLDTFFPIDSQEGQYNKEKVEAVINEFAETLSGSVDISGYGYRVLCWNEELRNNIDEFAEVTNAGPVIDTDDLQEDFYQIRIMEEPETGCFISDLYVGGDIIEGEQEGELTYIDVNGDIQGAVCGNSIDIYLDKDYNVIAYRIYIRAKVEEASFENIKIVPVSDILNSVYNKMKNSYKKVTVKDIRLVFSSCLDDTLDEDNTRTPYIAPYWVVTYYIEGQGSYYQMFYSAIDGALVQSVL